MIPTIVKAWINSVDFNVISKVEKEKNILNRFTWEIRRSMEKISCFLTLNHTHLSQPYIKSIDFLRDEGENEQNMLIFVSGCSTPLSWNLCFIKYINIPVMYKLYINVKITELKKKKIPTYPPRKFYLWPIKHFFFLFSFFFFFFFLPHLWVI